MVDRYLDHIRKIFLLLAEKGVPNFWVNAMKANDLLAEEVGIEYITELFFIPYFATFAYFVLFQYLSTQISERDEEALQHLTDIKWYRIDGYKGFKLEFFFGPNPYFKNSVLTKTYHMINEDEHILEKATG